MTKSLAPEQSQLLLVELLARMSREMDRFPVMLAQVEAEVSEIIAKNPESITKQTSAVLQTIDYMAQASAGISDLLVQVGKSPSSDLTGLVERVVPGDLSNRLLNTGLDDIDNTKRKIELF